MQPGDLVRHKQTGQVFVVGKIHPENVGVACDVCAEWIAELIKPDGIKAWWKVNQLEVMK